MKPRELTGDKRAVVALLLRPLRKPYISKGDPRGNTNSNTTTEEDGQEANPKDGMPERLIQPLAGGTGDDKGVMLNNNQLKETEMLFILRAANKNDRWSSQVGFPGGRQNEGETGEETCAREVFEEIGLVVQGLRDSVFVQHKVEKVAPSFHFAGKVHDRIIVQGSQTLVVACLVFMQTVLETPKMNLLPSEVASAGWVPLRFFLEPNCASPFVFDLRHSLIQQEAPRVVDFARLLGLDKVYFTKVQLPILQSDMYVSKSTSSSKASSASTITTLASPEQYEKYIGMFFLWGLTLSMVNDFLIDSSNLRSNRISLYQNIGVLNTQVEKLFRSKFHNVGVAIVRNSFSTIFGRNLNWSEFITMYIRILGAISMIPPVALGAAAIVRHRSKL